MALATPIHTPAPARARLHTKLNPATKVLTFVPEETPDQGKDTNLVGFFSMKLLTRSRQEATKYFVRHGQTVRIDVPSIKFNITFTMDIDELDDCPSGHGCLHYTTEVKRGETSRTVTMNFVETDRRTTYIMSAVAIYLEDPDKLAQKVLDEEKVTCTNIVDADSDDGEDNTGCDTGCGCKPKEDQLDQPAGQETNLEANPDFEVFDAVGTVNVFGVETVVTNTACDQ